MLFTDRRDAGQQLAKKLFQYRDQSPLVLGIPRGGVIVAAEVAKELETSLDVIIPRKIGAPFNRELAVGAVAPDGTVLYDDFSMRYLGLEQEVLQKQIARELEEIKRRLVLYRGKKKPYDCTGRIVVLIDDGIATGFTVQAAIRSLRHQAPVRLILAVPVAPQEVIARLTPEVDEVAILFIPDVFYAVSQFYRDFRQTTDEEVIAALVHNWSIHDTE